ncbi:endonuclease domain-containing protein [Fodinibius salsisoli]|uniref:Endonuclease domain-containing protein n=1 Tax=Fodinibius salsisoli TaxID=2820877 RepID=A0ABT3PRJ6_9BACT|nr:endonuclease domain-containing protein [Fodinibius salsisoli]MCW9708450.1 endonuclease domain-containing protein [Fodinibius salsisoli]
MTKWSKIRDLARRLRKHQTDAEKKLWQQLRRKQLYGYKFLRQHPIVYNKKKGQRFFFIADFYCAEAELVIELDGQIHDYQKEYDYNRDLVLQELGLEVLRLRNEELQNMDDVKQKILNSLK